MARVVAFSVFGFCLHRGYSRAFDTHAVSYQNITTQKILLEKKQISSSVQDRGLESYYKGRRYLKQKIEH